MEDAVEEAKQRKQNNGLFLVACARGLLSEAQTLLDWGAELGTHDKGGLSSVHFAAAHGKLDVLFFLWSKGVELDGEDPAGQTPLHLAAMCGHAHCVHMLLEKGSWADAFDGADNSALHLAARAGQLNTVEALLAGSAKTMVRNKRDLTPLGEALAAGHVRIAEAIVAAGADLGEKSRGLSLLHIAAGSDQHESIRWLLEKGAAVDGKDNEDEVTPLHCAAIAGGLESARLLIERGANLAACTKSGRAPVDLAATAFCGRRSKPLVALLTSKKPVAKLSDRATVQQSTMAPKPAVSATPSEAFLAMNNKDQLRRAQRWVEEMPNESKATTDALDAFAAEVRDRVVQAANVYHSINIQKALAALHQDEDFQQDLLRLPLQRVIDDTKKNPANYEKHVENPDIARALEKIRRFHSVVKANGGTSVDLLQMAAGNVATIEERDKQKLQEMETLYTAQLQAACAAAQASSQGAKAAKAAAEKAFAAEYAAIRRGGKSAVVPSREAQGSPLAVPLDDSSAAADIAAMANRSPLSWQSFKTEARRQGSQLLYMMAITLVAMYFMGAGPFASSGHSFFVSPSSKSSPSYSEL